MEVLLIAQTSHVLLDSIRFEIIVMNSFISSIQEAKEIFMKYSYLKRQHQTTSAEYHMIQKRIDASTTTTTSASNNNNNETDDVSNEQKRLTSLMRQLNDLKIKLHETKSRCEFLFKEFFRI